MAEKQHKSLDQCYFNDDETRNCNDRDDEHGPKNHQAEIVLPVPADAALTAGRKQRVQNSARLEREEEKRGVVGDRCDLKRIIMNKLATGTGVHPVHDCSPWE